MIAVVKAQARYRAPARYDDELVVRTWLRSMRGSVLKMAYEVVRALDGVLLCTGETTHIVVDRTMSRCALPQPYKEAFRSWLDA